MASLAVVCGGTALGLMAGGGRGRPRRRRGSGVLAGPVGDGTGPDSS